MEMQLEIPGIESVDISLRFHYFQKEYKYKTAFTHGGANTSYYSMLFFGGGN
jgi:hypothetical protein